MPVLGTKDTSSSIDEFSNFNKLFQPNIHQSTFFSFKELKSGFSNV